MLIKLIKKSKIIFILGVCLLPFMAQATEGADKPHLIERRLAFDVGSGNTKAQLSEFDVTDGKIVKTIAIWKEKVLYKADLELQGDGKFSEEVMDKGIAAIERILKKAEPYKPQKSFGVATAAYHEALNGQELSDRIYKIGAAHSHCAARLGSGARLSHSL